MIIASVSVGIVCGLVAGTASLLAGHSFWTVLASYTLGGMIAVPLFAALALSLSALCARMHRTTDAETPADLARHA